MSQLEFSAVSLALLGARVVGAAFVWTGLIKALAPHSFEQHLATLRIVRGMKVSTAVALAAGFETAWGVGLILGVAPAIMYPVTLILLPALSFVSYWGVTSGRAADCGCYGGYIQPSLGQSLALNGLYFALIAAAWAFIAPSSLVIGLPAIITVAIGLGVGALTVAAQRHMSRKGSPLLDLNPVKEGRPWRHSWAGGATANFTGEFLVAYLGPECPYCTRFVRIANAMLQSPKLPRVVGTVATSRERLDSFIKEKDIRFPVVPISQSLMSRIAQAVPTVVLVKSGIIERVWVGDMPPSFVDRFVVAFFPDALEAQRKLAQKAAASPVD